MIKRVGLDPKALSQGLFEPSKVPGLLLWLRADAGVTLDSAGRLAEWADPERHISLVKPTDWQRPLFKKTVQNGLPAVRFSSHPDWLLSLPDFTPRSQSLSVIVVARVSEVSHFGSFFSYGQIMDTNALSFRFSQFSSTGKLLLGNGPADKSQPLPGRGFGIFQADYDGDSHRFSLYENGNLIGSVDQPGVLPEKGPLTLGPFSGDIAEVFVFRAPPEAAIRAALTRHLQTRYGLNPDKLISPLALQLPFAYYPSSSEIEVAFDRESPLLQDYFGDRFLPPATPTNPLPGLGYALYTNLFTANGPLPDYAAFTPGKTGTTASFSLAPAADGATFEGDHKTPGAVLFKGYLDVPKTAVYTFYIRKYGVARFFVGDRMVVDQPSGHYGPLWKQRGGAIALAAGRHPVTLAAKLFGQPPELPLDLVAWSSDTMPLAPIPPALLSHDASALWRLPTSPTQSHSAIPAGLMALDRVEVRVVSLKDGSAVKSFNLPLDAGGRGQARFKVPELADGDYAVEWILAGQTIRATQTFTRRHFPFEKNELGLEHQVYPPFTPVDVKGKTVSVVDRTYTLNRQGLFDSVVSKDRELLAEPMKLVAVDGTGKRLEWRDPGLFSRGVQGRALHPDLAQFETEARADGLRLSGTVSMEEDGCARTTLTLNPEPRTLVPLSALYLELTFKDADVPLFHYTGNDAMRHNYAGRTPRGGKINWLLDQGWVPCAWTAEPGPDNGVIWDSTKIKHWGPGNRDNFCPYIWLGAEERGLAWFAGTDHAYVNDGLEPVQELSREGSNVVLRIHFIRRPTQLDKPLRYTFGLQASPTKPLRADWRSHKVPGGAGLPVNCWGGYLCSDKVPDGHDFTLVDKIQDARATGKVDEAWFKNKDQHRAWPDMKIQYEASWLADVLRFAGQAASQFKPGDKTSAVYFEEHVQFPRYPEWQVFQDEWSVFEFNRYQKDDGCWSQAARSYRDFALYYASEWMKRGVSLYFDNTYHREVTNPVNQDHGGRTSTLWEMRDYYKRIWKVLARLNLTGGAPCELDFTGHITNTQTIPCNTWMTGTLDLEQPYRIDKSRPPRGATPEGASWMSKGEGFRLPFPPDYTRAMTMGRVVGVIPHIMFPLPNWGDYRDVAVRNALTEENWNSDLGMQLVHELSRPSGQPAWAGGPEGYRGRRLADYLAWFGYGGPDVMVHNYWEEKPFVSVPDPAVTWLALERKDTKTPKPGTPLLGLLLLQSYHEAPAVASVRYPGGTAAMDLFTREVFVADPAGVMAVSLAGLYGTRLLAVAADRAHLPAAPAGDCLVFDDFELGLSSTLRQNRSNFDVVADDRQPGNHVLRIKPGHPGHERLMLQSARTNESSTSLHLRFRIPALPEKTGAAGVLSVTYRYAKEYPADCGYDLRLQVVRAADGSSSWSVEKIRALREGKEESFSNIGTNNIGRPLMKGDIDWHRLDIDTAGSRHTIRVDGGIVFEGSSDASRTGGFSIGPGWGWDTVVPYAEIDDLVWKRNSE